MKLISKSISKASILKYIFEILVVAFGVFLGIIVSENISKNKRKKELRTSIDLVLEELNFNRQSLKNSVAYHQILEKNYHKLFSNVTGNELDTPYLKSKYAPINKIENWKGPMIPNIETSMFQSIRTANILQDLDITAIQNISKTYSALENFNQFKNKWWDRFMSLNSETKTRDFMLNFDILFSDIVASETRMIQRIDHEVELLKQIDF